MIMGIGVDIVSIERFNQWALYPNKKLRKLFTDQEIVYCKSIQIKSAERFASHFAAKEAFYKALSASQIHLNKSFLTICKIVEIKRDQGQAPIFMVSEKSLELLQNINILLSLSHEKNYAIAFVVIEKV